MGATRGTPVQGARSAHNVDNPDLHASDVEDGAFTIHNDPDASEGEAMVMGGAGEYVATDVLTPDNYTEQPVVIPTLTADPASPVQGETWVRKTATAVGTPIGLLLALTTTLYTRELSIYDTGAVYRTELTVGA